MVKPGETTTQINVMWSFDILDKMYSHHNMKCISKQLARKYWHAGKLAISKLSITMETYS